MTVKRVIPDNKRAELKESKKYKRKNPERLSRKQLDELIVIMAKKLGLL